jgi:hypothetical protein
MTPVRARQWSPELLVVLAIPLAALAGGLATLRLADGDLSADGVAEGARRTAQVQEAELDPDLAAARAHLSASLRVDAARGELRVALPDASAARGGLRLDLLHSLEARRDLHARLEKRDGAWIARLAPDAGSRWRVVLTDSARRWRLVGTLERGGAGLALHPALAPP